MGILSLPRIYFDGHFHWNPSTFNNNDYINTYNPFHVELNRAWLEDQGVYTKEQFRKWAIQAQVVGGNTVTPPAEWNFHGGMQAGFLSETSPTIQNPDFSRPAGGTLTHGFTGTNGDYVNANDPWLNQQIQFNVRNAPGKLVDVDPTCFWSSQFFSDSFQLGSQEAGQGFSAPVTLPSHSRWINLFRNYNTTGEIIIAGGISCVWQTAFDKNDLTWFNSNPAAGSFQAQLQGQLDDATVRGLMLRWITYDTVYFQGDVFADLPAGNVNLRMARVAKLFQQYADEMDAFREGKTNKKPDTPINRAYSKSIGWLGLWNDGELATMPGGRMLFGGTNFVQAADLPASYYQEVNGSVAAQVLIAPTAVEIEYNGDDVARISVDMGSTMPEQQKNGEKANFGQVQLMLGTTDTEPGTALANLPNNLAEYRKTSGVVDLYPSDFLCSITKADIQYVQLGLSVESYTAPAAPGGSGSTARTTALVEAPYTANTDHRGVYVDESDPAWNEDVADPTFTIQVRYFGANPPDGTKIGFGQYAPSPLMVSSGQWNIVKSNSKVLQDPFVKVYQPLEGARDRVIGHSTVLDVPANGELTLATQAIRPGFANFAFYPMSSDAADSWNGAPPQVASPFISYAYYTVIRALPFDNLAAVDFENWLKSRPDTKHLPDVSLVNQRVFNQVFGLFYRLYPVMDFISNPTKWQEWRGRIMAVTDPNIFHSATYMPVTRNLSAGNRRILELWDTYLDGIQIGSEHNKAIKKQKQIR